MKKAFTTCFPSSVEADEDDDDCLDDSKRWNSPPVDERLNVTFTSKSHHRLQCFAYTLQSWAVSSALVKASRFSSLLHTSTSFKEFEKEFGQCGLPVSDVTQ